jgi:uncharacterized membrane protein
MEEVFKRLAASIAPSVEASGVLIIAFGAIEALWGTAKTLFIQEPKTGKRKAVWLSFGLWLLLGLEFELAADIVRTANMERHRPTRCNRCYPHVLESLP